MLPSQLKARQFKKYPAEARQLAIRHLDLLRELPASFVPLLLRELIEYDWKFPAERKQMDGQLAYLQSRSADQRQQVMAGFAQLRLTSELERLDWVNAPSLYSEKLAAYFWASHQIDAFRNAAESYIRTVNAATPKEPLPIPRLGIVVVGQGVPETRYPLFRKLRPHGVFFSQVKPANGVKTLLAAVSRRAGAHPIPYSHWYIDGGTGEAISGAGITTVSYNALAPARVALLNRMEESIQSGIGGPEALRTMLHQMRPEEIGLSGAADQAVLNRFQTTLLTEGSGTQIFSTTFVQWAAREAWARAQPLTLLARFAQRQRQRPMNELIASPQEKPALDPQGSLIDADMGAFYTWLNQQRLPGAEQSCFLAWFEDHNQALAISPTLPRHTESSSPVDLEWLLNQLNPS
ncbi:MAG TPA: hypothetical protein VMX16_04955 [Terriglobia bacterium]|nr:hypothetical protein [Terriglobia bacterium]